jgi:outer membrane lipopolysaccharide assembly protein LptE/RlpB
MAVIVSLFSDIFKQEQQSKQMKELQKLLYLSVLVVVNDGNNKQYPQLRLFSYRTSDRPLDKLVTARLVT